MITPGVATIRCSALSGWPDCPRRGAASLFRREIEEAGYRLATSPRGVGAAIGTSVHKGAETVLLEKAKTGTLPPASVATDAAYYTIKDQLHDGVTYDSATYNPAQAEHQVLSMTNAYHQTIAPTIDACIIEERLEAEIGPNLILSGQPDLVAREPGVIRDLKTGQRPSSHAPQIGGYALLARSNNLEIDSGVIDFIQRVSPTKPQPDPVTTELPIARAETAASNIIRHIVTDLQTFRHGDSERRIMPGDAWSFMANPRSKLCSQKWCPCWGDTSSHAFCREWQPK